MRKCTVYTAFDPVSFIFLPYRISWTVLLMIERAVTEKTVDPGYIFMAGIIWAVPVLEINCFHPFPPIIQCCREYSLILLTNVSANTGSAG